MMIRIEAVVKSIVIMSALFVLLSCSNIVSASQVNKDLIGIKIIDVAISSTMHGSNFRSDNIELKNLFRRKIENLETDAELSIRPLSYTDVVDHDDTSRVTLRNRIIEKCAVKKNLCVFLFVSYARRSGFGEIFRKEEVIFEPNRNSKNWKNKLANEMFKIGVEYFKNGVNRVNN